MLGMLWRKTGPYVHLIRDDAPACRSNVDREVPSHGLCPLCLALIEQVWPS